MKNVTAAFLTPHVVGYLGRPVSGDASIMWLDLKQLYSIFNEQRCAEQQPALTAADNRNLRSNIEEISQQIGNKIFNISAGK